MDLRTLENDSVETSDSIPEASNKPGAKRRGTKPGCDFQCTIPTKVVAVIEIPFLTQIASRAGSRSVATLNAEQLARKRANDREAQRSIRQRTKDHIERLENRIRELTEGQNGNLEEVQQRNAELERELRKLKESLQLNEDGLKVSDYRGPMGE